MPKIWITSDLHFGHANIIKFCQRPFSSVEEMDAVLIYNWNEIVGKDDIIYIVGDFTLNGPDFAADVFSMLNGKIFVMPGSHDHRWFEKQTYKSRDGHLVQHLPGLFTIPVPIRDNSKMALTLCHYAMRTWPASHYGTLHVFGHSHGKLDGVGRSMDIGVDAFNYRPVDLRDIKSTLLNKKIGEGT